jgi:hypothetical protein
VSVVTPRNSPPRARQDPSPGRRTTKSFRYELCNRRDNYTGTFVTNVEQWQIGDVFTSGDGRPLRITAIIAPEQSRERSSYTGAWEVEPIPTPS